MAGRRLLEAIKAFAITTPKRNNGRNCRILPCSMANIEEDANTAMLGGRYFPSEGSKNPLNIVCNTQKELGVSF